MDILWSECSEDPAICCDILLCCQEDGEQSKEGHEWDLLLCDDDFEVQEGEEEVDGGYGVLCGQDVCSSSAYGW